jgi:intein-encoded DNA endonuclease-like protein
MSQAPFFCPDPEGEEVKKMEDDTTNTKRQKIPPREFRIKMYNDVHKLRKRGLSYTEIRKEIYRKHGVWIGTGTISRWLRGVHSPYNGRRLPSLELLKPSEDLANVIGVVLGDGYTYERSIHKTSRGYIIGLEAKDKEFVEEFGRRLANVLGKEAIRPKFREGVGTYVVKATSKTLYELLKKPVDLKRIKPYVEHCPKCAAAFLRGLFDSEACIGKDGHIKLYNTNYEVLVYAQKLLWKYFGIESTGPWPHKQKEGYYYIYIRAESLLNFYRYIGFTILRKQKRLEEYLKRTGKI